MLRNKLVRSDGSIIDSSVIISCEFSEEVNSDNNLTVGDVTSSELIVEMLSTVPIEYGEILTYYIIEDDVETLIGNFNVDKPTVASRTSIKFSAYDNVIKTERLFSDWLILNQNLFPMRLLELVQYACSYCGVALATTDFPHADLSVNAFYGDDITSRQIIRWAAAIAGRFVRANNYGEIEFAWYSDKDAIICAPSSSDYSVDLEIENDGDGNVTMNGGGITVADDGDGNVNVTIPHVSVVNTYGEVSLVPDVVIPYFQNGVTYENYTTDTIEMIRINHSDSDVGVVFPVEATGNCFTMTGNMILGTCDIATANEVAAGLYNTLHAITYTPAKIHVPRTIRIRAGSIIRVLLPNGETIRTYAMRVSVSSSGTNIESTGDKSYSSNAAVANGRYSNLTGKMLEVTANAEALETKNTDLEGRISQLTQRVNGFETLVQDTNNEIDELRENTTKQQTNILQTADSLISTATSTLVTKDALAEYSSTVTTKFEQTDRDLEIKFSNQSSRIEEVNGDLQTKYEERTKYIRFVDGNIILGKDGNSVVLTIENERISFKQNGIEVAYMAANDMYKKLYIVDGEFIGNLQVGKFAMLPRDTGNLSIKKVSV